MAGKGSGMSALVAQVAGAQARGESRPQPFLPVLIAVLAGVCLSVSFGAEKLGAVWQAGAFFDSDDAMRLVQVRDWLGGQAWFDLTAHRLLPPDGVTMHWSRVIDVPLGLLIRLFSLAAPQETAERLTRIAFPLLCLTALLFAMIRLARSLMPGTGPYAPALLSAATGMLLVQFAPGRIDHHAPQICLLVLFASETIRALDGRHAASAAVAAALATLSISISLENLPFVAVLAAILGIDWIHAGRAMDHTLLCAGAAFSLGGALLFAATVGPSRYGVASCDAFSLFHLATLTTGGAALAALGLLGGARLPGRAVRLGAAALAALAALAAATLAGPACLGDPLGAIDPFLREHWLKDVREARPLFVVLRETPAMFAPIALAPLLGAVAALWACASQPGAARGRWLALCAFIAVGIVLAIWQVRALASLAPLAVIGGVFAVNTIWQRATRTARLPLAGAAALAAGLPFCSLFWAAAMPVAQARPGDAAAKAACMANASYAPLAEYGDAVVLAPVDIGAHLLANTRLRPIAAPYHRNNTGNRAAIEFFLAGPDAAQAIARRMQAGYLVLCPALTELAIYAANAPEGMAARLAQGRVPDWLRAVKASGGAMAVYAID